MTYSKAVKLPSVLQTSLATLSCGWLFAKERRPHPSDQPPAWQKKSGSLLALCAMAFFFVAGQTESQAQTKEEVKSAFLYNFAKFTSWPDSAFTNDSAPIKLVFVGADAFATAFESVTKGKNANGREFSISKGTVGDAASGHVVVVEDAAQFAAVVANTKGKPVLTVGSEGFTASGGMVDFFSDGGKVSIKIELGPLKEGGLSMEPKILKVAKSVSGQ